MIRNNVPDFNAHSTASNKPEALPAGLYEGIIKGARVEDTPWGGQRLVLALDVTQGEHKFHYQNMFDWETKNSNYQPKWKGTLRQNIPTGDGSEKDAWTKRSLEGLVFALEDSNPGYHWDWDENKLKGLKVGLNVRNKEWEYNDMTGWTTEIARLESLNDMAAGNVRVAKDRPLNNASETIAPANNAGGDSNFTPVETDDLPF